MREDVKIQAQVTLDAWLYRPDKDDKRRPAIVMSHGLAAVKDLCIRSPRPFAMPASSSSYSSTAILD